MTDVDVAKSSSPLIHIFLFTVTAITVGAAGLMAAGLDPFAYREWHGPALLDALAYALWMLAIVAAHEAGHFVAARRRGVEVSWPYFLPGIGPIPGLGVIPFFGTFGAFIRMGWRKMKAVDLMAVAGWGPLAGFAVTVPAVLVGVALSEPQALATDENFLLLGDPLLIQAAAWAFHPPMEEGMELMLHPIGLAGWVGCLLTALNLLPVGQLDGGHLLYAAVGERSRQVAKVLFVVLLGLGFFFFTGWLVLAALIFWMGVVHPPMLSGPPAKGRDRWMLWVCAGIFILTFTPSPVVVDAIPQLLGLW